MAREGHSSPSLTLRKPGPAVIYRPRPPATRVIFVPGDGRVGTWYERSDQLVETLRRWIGDPDEAQIHDLAELIQNGLNMLRTKTAPATPHNVGPIVRTVPTAEVTARAMSKFALASALTVRMAAHIVVARLKQGSLH